MGSWSETCGLSGIEIAEDEEAYCVLFKLNKHGSLNDGAFHHYTPFTTLIRGTYNDYGRLKVNEDQAILDIFNEQAGITLKNGEDFSMSHLDGIDCYRWWVRADIFDTLGDIEPDFPYSSVWDEEGKYRSVKVVNIGEMIDVRLSEGIAHIRREVDKGPAGNLGSTVVRRMAIQMRLRDVFGYRAVCLDRDRLEEDIVAGAEIQPQLDAYRRVALLGIALGELRKTLHPCESCGPQHGGEAASVQLANRIIDIQEQRADRQEEM